MFKPPRPKRSAARLSILSLTLVLLATGCRSRKTDFGMFRVIDHIRLDNIVRSPLPNRDPKNAALAEIADLEPTEDLGTGENPFLIKKKLHIGMSDFNALTAVPPTEIRFRLRVPPGTRFEFYPAIRFDNAIFRAKAGSRSTTFSVFVVAEGREIPVFKKNVVLGPEKVLAISKESLDLSSFAGREVVIRLITKGDEQSLAFWINPILRTTREDARFVILISLDTLRADHLGCYGYGRDTSPNMDALARDGVRFSRVMAASSWTLPSHISLMTGLNPVNHGVVAPELRLDAGVPTLAEVLKDRGFYNAALTGGGLVSGFFGFNKGFDSFRVVGEIKDTDAAGRLGETAAGLIRANRDRNLFLFLHSYQIHAPFSPKEPFNRYYLREGAKWDKIDTEPLRFNFEKRYVPVPEDLRLNIVDLYDAEIRYTDESLIGSLVERLKSLGIYDRTMIILTSDHGEEFFEHGSWLHSHSVYDEVVRVPLIVKFFGSRNAGKTVDDPVRGVDVMPTICRELGIRALPGPVDGESLLERADGSGSGNSAAKIGVSALASYAMNKHTPAKMALLRFPYKFIWNAPFSSDDLAFYGAFPPPFHETEIYDLSRDPGEKADLAASRPDLVRKFRELMAPFRVPKKKTGARKSGIGEDFEKQLKTLGYL
jgi:arylsulfatase A-like enzyme